METEAPEAFPTAAVSAVSCLLSFLLISVPTLSNRTVHKALEARVTISGSSLYQGTLPTAAPTVPQWPAPKRRGNLKLHSRAESEGHGFSQVASTGWRPEGSPARSSDPKAPEAPLTGGLHAGVPHNHFIDALRSIPSIKNTSSNYNILVLALPN